MDFATQNSMFHSLNLEYRNIIIIWPKILMEKAKDMHGLFS